MAKVKQNKKSPQRELFSEFLNSCQRKEMREVFGHLKQEDIDETCVNLLIYLRYDFELVDADNYFMIDIFNLCRSLIEEFEKED